MDLRQTVCSSIFDVLPDSPGIAVIHSSIINLAPTKAISRWDILSALGELLQSGWTIALPAFTFSFCRGEGFHYQHSVSETGVLADWVFDAFPESIRTPHPIYSFVVVGPRAADIAVLPSTTTFGDDSPFALFETENARQVMLGCGWEYCTQIHRSEESAEVPYRFFKLFEGQADFGQGPAQAAAKMYVRDLDLDPILDLNPVIETLRDRGAIATATLFRGVVEAVDTAALSETAAAMMAEDPCALLGNGRQIARALAARAEAEQQPVLRLAVLGSSNLHRLEEAFGQLLGALLPERKVAFHTLAFGQMYKALADPNSALAAFATDVRIFCDRIEDLAPGGAPDAIEAAAQRYADAIAVFHGAQGGWSVVHRFAALGVVGDSAAAQAAAAQVSRLNSILDERLGDLDQLLWIDLAAEAATHPGPVLDPRLWYLGRFPFTEDFTARLARRWAGYVLAAQGKTARLVVLDLDNTLWGGVLGEDGLEGVQIGGDYPGNAFADFQAALKRLSVLGFALAVASKNDEDLAVQALDGLPFQAIRSADLSAHRINWSPKWQNIRDMAAELNLGLGSVLFIDDNPVEREQVRANLPDVKILELPADPCRYTEVLADCPYLATAVITAEDRKRQQSYKARRQMITASHKAANLDEFYASLGIKLYLQPLDTGNAQRAMQLCQKTNQFNTTTRRFDLGALRQLQDAGADIVVIGLEDRYAAFENMGVMVLVPDDAGAGRIDLYLLSCRVLGRGIETAIPRWACARAARRGWATISGKIIETERNTPVRSVYADAGFTKSSDQLWIAGSTNDPDLPGWLTVIDTLNN